MVTSVIIQSLMHNWTHPPTESCQNVCVNTKQLYFYLKLYSQIRGICIGPKFFLFFFQRPCACTVSAPLMAFLFLLQAPLKSFSFLFILYKRCVPPMACPPERGVKSYTLWEKKKKVYCFIEHVHTSRVKDSSFPVARDTLIAVDIAVII